MLALLLTTASLAAPYPLELPPDADPADWQPLAAEAGFVLTAHTGGAGGALRSTGGQWELIVEDQDGSEHRVRLPPPAHTADREAALSLAASLIRPARWSIPIAPPPITPTAAPVEARTEVPAAAPVVHTQEATVAAVAAAPAPKAPPQAESPASLESAAPKSTESAEPETAPVAVSPPPPHFPIGEPLSLSLNYQVTADAGSAWRPDTSSGLALSLSGALVQGTRWLGVSFQADSSSAVETSANEIGLSVGAGWRSRRRVALQVGGWGGLVVRESWSQCSDCSQLLSSDYDLQAVNDLSTDVSLSPTDGIIYASTAMLPIVAVETALHVPIRPWLALTPSLTLQRDLIQSPMPDDEAFQSIPPLLIHTGIGVTIHDLQKH